MKLITTLAGLLLGFVFNFVALNFFFNFVAMPPPPEGSPPAMFLGAMLSSGYFTFLKIFEISGGIFVAFHRTRPLGLLILGPIIVNILCFHVFLTKGAGLIGLPLLVAVLALFLLWTERESFSRLFPGAR